jgi:hypothetical protein
MAGPIFFGSGTELYARGNCFDRFCSFCAATEAIPQDLQGQEQPCLTMKIPPQWRVPFWNEARMMGG